MLKAASLHISGIFMKIYFKVEYCKVTITLDFTEQVLLIWRHAALVLADYRLHSTVTLRDKIN
jgi:hypothetical protein